MNNNPALTRESLAAAVRITITGAQDMTIRRITPDAFAIGGQRASTEATWDLLQKLDKLPGTKITIN